MSLPALDSMVQDVRFGLRLLGRRPLETALIIAVLALGAGLSTAMFSIVWGTILRGLPFENSKSLVRIEAITPEETVTPLSSDYLSWRARHGSFEGMAAWLGSSFNLSGAGLTAERVNGAFVSADTFRLIQVAPVLGRDFHQDDERPNAPAVALLSTELWKKLFGGDPKVLGRLIELNGLPARVVGVMPEGLGFPLRQEIWVPLQIDPAPKPGTQPYHIQVFGKLKEGVARRQAAAELSATTAPRPETEAEETIRVTPYVEAYTADLQPIAYLLLAASIGLLLVVCANVAGLLTAQMIHRLPELAVRGALGATRGRLQAQLFIETTILALIGSAAGLPLAGVVIRAYAESQWGENRSFWMDVRLDTPTILYTLVIALLVSALSSLIPALRVTGPRLHEILQRGAGKGTTNPPGLFSRASLTVQLAVSFALLAATGLLTASLANTHRRHLGFAPEKVLTAQLLVPYATYPESQQQLGFFDSLEQRLEGASGPGSVAFASALPASTADEATVELEGSTAPPGSPVPYLVVSHGYFPLLRVSALQGRLFDTSDGDGDHRTAIVNQRFVRRFFPTRSPVGARFRFVTSRPGPWRTIVGVVPDILLGDSSTRRPEGVYVSIQQAPSTWMAVLVRTPQPPESFHPMLRQAVAAIDRDVPVFWIRTLKENGDLLGLPVRTMSRAFAVFAFVAFVLSLVGAYGVTARDVASRARELAIRLALGGTRKDLIRLIVAKAVPQVIAGIVLGALLSRWTARFLESFLFGVQPGDLTLLAGIGCAFLLAALAACLSPAVKTLGAQPAETLREG